MTRRPLPTLAQLETVGFPVGEPRWRLLRPNGELARPDEPPLQAAEALAACGVAYRLGVELTPGLACVRFLDCLDAERRVRPKAPAERPTRSLQVNQLVELTSDQRSLQTFVKSKVLDLPDFIEAVWGIDYRSTGCIEVTCDTFPAAAFGSLREMPADLLTLLRLLQSSAAKQAARRRKQGGRDPVACPEPEPVDWLLPPAVVARLARELGEAVAAQDRAALFSLACDWRREHGLTPGQVWGLFAGCEAFAAYCRERLRNPADDWRELGWNTVLQGRQGGPFPGARGPARGPAVDAEAMAAAEAESRDAYTVTVAQCRSPGGTGTKRLVRDPATGRTVKDRPPPVDGRPGSGAAYGRRFAFKAVQLGGGSVPAPEDVLNLLQRLQARPDLLVVLGVPVTPNPVTGAPGGGRLAPELAGNGQGVRRLAVKNHGDAGTLREVRCGLLVLDFDGVLFPEGHPDHGTDPTDAAAAGRAVRQLVPGLQDVQAVAQLTSGAGLGPALQVRLWLLLDRPSWLAEGRAAMPPLPTPSTLRHFAKQVTARMAEAGIGGQLDSSLYSAGHVVLTAAPTLGPGAVDPCAGRPRLALIADPGDVPAGYTERLGEPRPEDDVLDGPAAASGRPRDPWEREAAGAEAPARGAGTGQRLPRPDGASEASCAAAGEARARALIADLLAAGGAFAKVWHDRGFTDRSAFDQRLAIALIAGSRRAGGRGAGGGLDAADKVAWCAVEAAIRLHRQGAFKSDPVAATGRTAAEVAAKGQRADYLDETTGRAFARVDGEASDGSAAALPPVEDDGEDDDGAGGAADGGAAGVSGAERPWQGRTFAERLRELGSGVKASLFDEVSDLLQLAARQSGDLESERYLLGEKLRRLQAKPGDGYGSRKDLQRALKALPGLCQHYASPQWQLDFRVSTGWGSRRSPAQLGSAGEDTLRLLARLKPGQRAEACLKLLRERLSRWDAQRALVTLLGLLRRPHAPNLNPVTSAPAWVELRAELLPVLDTVGGELGIGAADDGAAPDGAAR